MDDDPLPLGGDGDDRPTTVRDAEAVLRRLAGTATLRSEAPARNAPHTTPSRLGHPERDALPGSSPGLHASSVATLEAEHLRAALEAVPDALLIVGDDGRVVMVNAQAEKLFGYRRDEMVGQPVELLIPERFRARHVGLRGGYFADPHVRPMGRDLELFGRRKDGSEVPVEISLSPVRIGGALLVVSTVRDVSERKRAEAQLRQMEARYRTLVEGIPAVTFMAALDEAKNELYVSPQIEELLGFSQKEWLENPVLWFTQLHPEDRTRWHTEFARTCATGERFRDVYRFIARDGRVVWVQGEAVLVRDEHGRPLFLQGVAFDITGIKEAEAQLRAVNQTLEKRVAERTAVAEFRAKALARSNEMLESLAYTVSHDLRQPLRTMKSFIQKLSERYQGRLDAEGEDYITRSINAADRMRTLIDDLLAFSRAQTQGKQPTPTPCTDALDAARANLQATIEETQAAVTSGELPVVVADPTQLAQLFQNLIGNALKFRAVGRQPQVHVAAQRRGMEWLIAITDNGIGIEPQYLKQIFGLGERLHTISKYPGSGIGLATCEKIVQRHGGQIWASSPGLDQGATFAFTLPAVTSE